jgi:hypothetical protein
VNSLSPTPTTRKQTEHLLTPTSVKCIPVHPESLKVFWPLVSHFIQMAIDKGSDRFCLSDVLKLLEEKKAQLFVFRDEEILGACVTTIESSRACKWLRIMWAGGRDLDKWFHFLEPIEQWAKSIGCEKVVIIGRKGWEKKLNDYRKTSVILEKVI